MDVLKKFPCRRQCFGIHGDNVKCNMGFKVHKNTKKNQNYNCLQIFPFNEINSLSHIIDKI